MKKLKWQYKRMVAVQRLAGGIYEHYPNIRSYMYKHFSTKQEKGLYFLHRAEYKGSPLKLRATRGNALPDPWEEYPAQIYNLRRSWKYNSKRPQQYYNHRYFE